MRKKGVDKQICGPLLCGGVQVMVRVWGTWWMTSSGRSKVWHATSCVAKCQWVPSCIWSQIDVLLPAGGRSLNSYFLFMTRSLPATAVPAGGASTHLLCIFLHRVGRGLGLTILIRCRVVLCSVGVRGAVISCIQGHGVSDDCAALSAVQLGPRYGHITVGVFQGEVHTGCRLDEMQWEESQEQNLESIFINQSTAFKQGKTQEIM